MDWTSGQLAERIGIPQQTLQTWLKRFPDLIEMSGGGGPGHHRRFPIRTVFQIVVAAKIHENYSWSIRRLLEIGKIAADYQPLVRSGDQIVMLITPNDVFVGPDRSKQLVTEHGVPRDGTYIYLTDLYREFFGPHLPRGLQKIKPHLRGNV